MEPKLTDLQVCPRLESPAAVLAREGPLRGVHDGRVTRQQRLGAERAAALRARELAAARAGENSSDLRLLRPDDLKRRLDVCDRRHVQLDGVPSLEPLVAFRLGAEEDRARVHPAPERQIPLNACTYNEKSAD